MKVSIVGGAGRVGSSSAFAIASMGVADEVVLVDIAEDRAMGEALDLLHCSSISSGCLVLGGGYELLDGSDVVVVAAGARRMPEETRLQLAERNAMILMDALERVMEKDLGDGWMLIVVTNPVDLLTYVGWKKTGLPRERVIGTGTMLDTARFRSLIGRWLGLDPRQVDAMIIGEHGDSMVPVWSRASVGGVPIRDVPGFSEEGARFIFEEVKKAGAEMIRLKGGAGSAIGFVVASILDAISRDKKSILPISTVQNGPYGLHDVPLSLPTVVGRGGAEMVLEMRLEPDEISGLLISAGIIKEGIEKLRVSL